MRLCAGAVLLLGMLLCSCGNTTGPAGAPEAGEAAEPEPPETGEAQSLSQIVRILEFQGYTAIAEAESEGEYWEIEAFKDGERFKLNVDPVDGHILSAVEPSYQMPLSDVLAGLGELGYGPAVKVEFGISDGDAPVPAWEIEIYNGGHAVLLSVDAETGEILSED